MRGNTAKIVSISTVFPTPSEPGRGLFVRSRLRALAGLAEIRVIAPVWGFGAENPGISEQGIQVSYPRWMYVPGAGAPTRLGRVVQ
jgi:hypothetical protein